MRLQVKADRQRKLLDFLPRNTEYWRAFIDSVVYGGRNLDETVSEINMNTEY